MRILIIFLGTGFELRPDKTHLFPLSGGSRHFVEVCKRWIAWGHEVHVLTTVEGAQALRLHGLTAQYHTLSISGQSTRSHSTFGMALTFFLQGLKGATKILPCNFDVICASSHYIYNTLPLVSLLKKNTNSSGVVYLHHLFPTPLSRRRFHPLLPSIFSWLSQELSLLLMNRYVNKILVYPFVKSELARRGFPGKKMSTMYNGLNHKQIQQLKIEEIKYDVVFLGRITPLKGIYDLIDVWRLVCKEKPDARLAVIGDGNVDLLSNKVKRTYLEDSIMFLGFLDGEEKYSALKSSQLFLFPSYEEGWGIAVCEAMACGLPVVAYDLPAYKHIYKRGINVVPIGDKKALAREVVKLLKDPKQREKLGKEATEQASIYDWDSEASRELLILSDACAVGHN